MPAPRRVNRRPRIHNAVGGFASGLTLVDKPITSSWPTWTQITGHANANEKGAWSQLIASTSAAASVVYVTVANSFGSGANTSQLVDIGIGAEGSETVLIPNIGAGYATSESATVWAPSGREWFFPISVPAGSRLAARVQSAVSTGDTVDCRVELYSGGSSGSAVDAIGASTAASKGVDVAAGLSSAEGNWVEIEDATTARYHALLWAVQGAADLGLVAGRALLDVGVGAAGSEVAVITNQHIATGAAETVGHVPVLPTPVNIPTGSRLAARLQFDQAGAQSLDVILYGVR